MDFKESIKCEPQKTQKDLEVEAYIEYVRSQGQHFIEFIELLNDCIGIAEKYELIGDTNIKARIKDFDSSYRNTEKKAVDDTFGVEIIPTTERDREWIMLLTELVFKIGKNKGLRITDNGYVAYNQMVSLREDVEEYNFSNIMEIIKNAKIQEKRSHSSSKMVTVDKYPILKAQVQKGKNLEFSDLEKMAMLEIVQKLNAFRSKIRMFKTCSYMPLIEMQIKTSAVAEEAIRGRARHDNYKVSKKKGETEEEFQLRIKENQERIKRLYNSGYLKIGINVPIKLVRVNKKMTMQESEDGFMESHPELRTSIVQDRIDSGIKKTREYNKHIAKYQAIYPFLKPYILYRGEIITEEAITELKLLMKNTDITNADCVDTKTIRRGIIICKNQNY